MVEHVLEGATSRSPRDQTSQAKLKEQQDAGTHKFRDLVGLTTTLRSSIKLLKKRENFTENFIVRLLIEFYGYWHWLLSVQQNHLPGNMRAKFPTRDDLCDFVLNKRDGHELLPLVPPSNWNF
jgi:hypothetical protein